MPVYTYKCPKCNQIEEVFEHIVDLDKEMKVCWDCKKIKKRIITTPANITPDYEPWLDENMNDDGTPVYVKSRSHQRELLKQRGLFIRG